ncbi:FtsX-like permease family protein [Pseudobacter ginsenosidimutans]|uniref:Lipoprotein-releasing system permease protein n=1 Tax=Pseudobacter ginsenosidimutans TaxID=661488 RepID=A0A4Q7MTQ6_9BACT|nr:FtsX-like permease family protein [Pseudobacter ginsenosidimutans]QEC41871.1 ABC transporter permease [Pseudobacter ginsenosidimutans]RZS71309.1 lipoprotein-releasing system permease protein [Pseudobacter ginsenosidimutans]
MNFLFAWRYFKAKKSTNAINVIAWVSMIAIMCITFAFIVVLSVFNGFEGLVKSLYSSFYTDIRISPAKGKLITLTKEQLQQLRSNPQVRHYSLMAEEKTLLLNDDIQVIADLKGVDSNYKFVAGVPEKMFRGSFLTGNEEYPTLVLGNGVENALGVESDKNVFPLTVYLFKRGATVNTTNPYESFAASNINTAGTFMIQADIDNKFAITNLAFMKRMMNLGPDEYSAAEIALLDGEKADEVKKQLRSIFGEQYRIETKYEQNQSLYSVMTMEKWATYGILTLMLIVAAFTMIGGLTMLVLEKQKDIQALKAMGADNRLVQKIFLSEGILLAGIGAGAGIVLALIFCWAQVRFKLIPLEGGTFLIDYYPVKILPQDFVLILITVLFVAILASWFPSRKAALQPIELKT